jgi:cystathionine beta-lyase
MGIVACEAAYTYGEEWYQALKKYLKENLDFTREYIKKEIPKIKLIEPEGTYLIWLDFRELGLNEDELEDLILHKAKLWLDSGAIFGTVGEGFERINIATNREVLREALDRIKKCL